MVKFFFKLKKKPFVAHFPKIFGQKAFFQKIWLCHIQLHKGFSGTMPNWEKSNDPIQTNHLDKWQDGRTDKLYFKGLFQLPPGVQQVQLQ